MKKFYAFMIAAAAFMVSCVGPAPTPDDDQDNGKNEAYYGLTLNDAQVLNRGDYYGNGTNSYIVTMNKMENGEPARIFVAEIVTPEVNDGIIPEGKYTVADGAMAEGSLDGLLTGSFFVRNTEEDGYIQLATDGFLEVKHIAEGYQLTAEIVGIDANTGSKVAKAEGRFEGKPKMTGLPASNNYSVYNPAVCQAVYSPYGDGIAFWTIILADNNLLNGKYPAHLTQMILVVEDNGPEVLPQGTFYVDNYMGGVMNTQLINVNVLVESETSQVEDYAVDGKLTIKANGEGKYTIEAVSFGEFGAYKQSYSGPVQLFDESVQDIEFDDAQARFQGEYEGNTWWVLFLLDQAGDNLFQLYVNTPGDNTAAAGIPTGEYEVAGTMEPFTIDEGYVDEEGYANGSMVLDMAQTQVKDLVTGGTAYITNNGDGTYAIDVDFVGYNGDTIVGTYEGAMKITDDSQGGGGEPGGDQGGDLTQIAINIAAAEMYWYGNGQWVLYLVDPAINGGVGCAMQYFVLSDATAFADGLPSGAYTVAETGEPNTVFAGFQDEEGYLNGSLALTGNFQSYYDLVTSGNLTVDNKGNDSYAFEFATGGTRYLFTGAYDGAVTVIDATQQAVAPLRANIAPVAPNKAFKAGNAKKGSNLKVSPLMTARAADFEVNKVIVF